MSEKMTKITLPECPDVGFMAHGACSVAEMISMLRSHAEYEKRKAEAVLNAPDAAFQIDIVRGVYRQTLIKSLQSPVQKREQAK